MESVGTEDCGILTAMRNASLLTIVSLILVPFVAQAFSWKAKTAGEEKVALIEFLNGTQVAKEQTAALVARLVAQSNTTDWMQSAIDFGSELLRQTEGQTAVDPLRRLALETIDYPLHVDNYGPRIVPAEMTAFNDMVIRYAREAKDRVLREVREAQVPEGELWIWRIYNMAFVLKGPRHTVAIDFTNRPELIAKPYSELLKDFNSAIKSGKGPKTLDFHAGAPQVWSETDWQAFADVVDIAFVTHPHGDHTSEPFLREMMHLKKPLVLPGDILCRAQVGGKPQVNWVPFTTRETCHKLTLDHSEPIDIGGISIRNFLGNQGKGVPCNVYLLEIDGVRIVDNGDNYARDKEKMLENAPPADVIIASTWNQVNHILGCVQKAEGFNPQTAAFLPAHENELGHSVNHRESYHEMYTDPNRLGNSVFPLERTFPLGWGECFKFRR